MSTFSGDVPAGSQSTELVRREQKRHRRLSFPPPPPVLPPPPPPPPHPLPPPPLPPPPHLAHHHHPLPQQLQHLRLEGKQQQLSNPPISILSFGMSKILHGDKVPSERGNRDVRDDRRGTSSGEDCFIRCVSNVQHEFCPVPPPRRKLETARDKFDVDARIEGYGELLHPQTSVPPAVTSVAPWQNPWMIPVVANDFNSSQWGAKYTGRRIGHPYRNRVVYQRKKMRTSFSRHQLTELERRFHRQKYIASADRSLLAQTLGMTDTQVKTWFQNRRTKWRRLSLEEVETGNKNQSKNGFMLSRERFDQMISTVGFRR